MCLSSNIRYIDRANKSEPWPACRNKLFQKLRVRSTTFQRPFTKARLSAQVGFQNKREWSSGLLFEKGSDDGLFISQKTIWMVWQQSREEELGFSCLMKDNTTQQTLAPRLKNAAVIGLGALLNNFWSAIWSKTPLSCLRVLADNLPSNTLLHFSLSYISMSMPWSLPFNVNLIQMWPTIWPYRGTGVGLKQNTSQIEPNSPSNFIHQPNQRHY